MTKRKLAPIIVGLGLAACATAAAIAIPAAVASEKERAEVITYNPSPQLDQWGPPGDRPRPEDQAEWDKFMAEHCGHSDVPKGLLLVRVVGSPSARPIKRR